MWLFELCVQLGIMGYIFIYGWFLKLCVNILHMGDILNEGWIWNMGKYDLWVNVYYGYI